MECRLVPQLPVGDQPSDIERQIRSLVLDYISKPNWYVHTTSDFPSVPDPCAA